MRRIAATPETADFPLSWATLKVQAGIEPSEGEDPVPRNYDSEIATITGISSVVAGALALVNSIASRIQAAIDAFKADNPEADTTELDAALADANNNAQALAAAVAANTPADPAAPAPTPAPTDTTVAPGSGAESTVDPVKQDPNGGAEAQSS